MMKMRFSACAAEAPSSEGERQGGEKGSHGIARGSRTGLVHRENASKTVKAALTQSRPDAAVIGLDGGGGALDGLPGAWTIVPRHERP